MQDQDKNKQNPNPIQPVSAGSVEAPYISADVHGEDLGTPSEAELRITQELEKAGVEVVSERPVLTQEHRQVGIEHSGENAPVPVPSSSSSGGFTDPLPTEQEAKNIVKTLKNSVDRAILWASKLRIKNENRKRLKEASSTA